MSKSSVERDARALAHLHVVRKAIEEKMVDATDDADIPECVFANNSAGEMHELEMSSSGKLGFLALAATLSDEIAFTETLGIGPPLSERWHDPAPNGCFTYTHMEHVSKGVYRMTGVFRQPDVTYLQPYSRTARGLSWCDPPLRVTLGTDKNQAVRAVLGGWWSRSR